MSALTHSSYLQKGNIRVQKRGDGFCQIRLATRGTVTSAASPNTLTHTKTAPNMLLSHMKHHRTAKGRKKACVTCERRQTFFYGKERNRINNRPPHKSRSAVARRGRGGVMDRVGRAGGGGWRSYSGLYEGASQHRTQTHTIAGTTLLSFIEC